MMALFKMVHLEQLYTKHPSACYFALAVAMEAIILRVVEISSNASFSSTMNTMSSLPDKVHDTWLGSMCDQSGSGEDCPEWARYWFGGLPDLQIVVALLGAVMLVVSAGYRNQRQWWRTFRLVLEFTTIQSLLLLMRASTAWVTTLPAPSPLCRNVTLSSLPERGSFVTQIYCNDSIFSGHVAHHCLILVMCLYSHLHWCWKILWCVWVLLSIVASTTTRDHYTVDVLLSVYITVPIALHRRKEFTRLFGKGARFM